MIVNNLKSLLGEIAGVPNEMESMGNDKRYLVQQLRELGFVKVNDNYYRLIIESKGQRYILGCRFTYSAYTFMVGNKKLVGGYFRDYVRFGQETQLRLARQKELTYIWSDNLPSNLGVFDNTQWFH